MALLSLSDAVVSNDSGLMHVAAALDKPLLGLFGPTPTDYTPPLGERSQVLALDLSCAPCGERECPLHHHRCMRDLGVDRVDAQLGGLLQT